MAPDDVPPLAGGIPAATSVEIMIMIGHSLDLLIKHFLVPFGPEAPSLKVDDDPGQFLGHGEILPDESDNIQPKVKE